jgi:hypothetical protein
MMLDSKAILNMIAVKLAGLFEDDEDLKSQLRDKVVESLSPEVLQQHPDIRDAVSKMVISVIESLEPSDDDELFNTVKNSLNLSEALEFLVKEDEDVKKALKSRMTALIKEELDAIECDTEPNGDGESISTIIQGKLGIDGDLIKETINADDKLQASLRIKVGEFIDYEIDNLEADDDTTQKIREAMPVSAVLKELFGQNQPLREKFSDSLDTILRDYLDGLTEEDTAHITGILVDSPVFIEFIDAAAARLMQSAEYQEKITRVVEQVMGNPAQIMKLVQERIAENIAANVVKKLENAEGVIRVDVDLPKA